MMAPFTFTPWHRPSAARIANDVAMGSGPTAENGVGPGHVLTFKAASPLRHSATSINAL